MLHRFLLCSITALTASGCASGGGAGAESTEELEAPVLMGAYRVDIRINFAPSRSGRSPGGATDINGVLTFRDEMYMDFVSDIGFTRLPFPCLYDVRGSRIETQCSGYRFTFRMDNEGRIRVDGGEGSACSTSAPTPRP